MINPVEVTCDIDSLTTRAGMLSKKNGDSESNHTEVARCETGPASCDKIICYITAACSIASLGIAVNAATLTSEDRLGKKVGADPGAVANFEPSCESIVTVDHDSLLTIATGEPDKVLGDAS